MGRIVVGGIVAVLLFDAAGAFASQRFGFSYALLVPGSLLLYAIVAALVARRREWLLGFLAAMALAFTDVTVGWFVSALIGPGTPPGGFTVATILGGAMTAFVLGGLAGGIGAAVGARMARPRAALAIVGLSVTYVSLTIAACATGKQRTIDETACAVVVSNLTPHSLEIRVGDRRLGTTPIGSINPGELLNYAVPCSRGGVWVRGIPIPSHVGAPVSFQSVQSWAELVKGERVEVALHWP